MFLSSKLKSYLPIAQFSMIKPIPQRQQSQTRESTSKKYVNFLLVRVQNRAYCEEENNPLTAP